MPRIDSFLETKDVARLLHCSTHHVTTLRKSSLLKGTRYGKRWLYSESDVQEFLALTRGKDLSNIKDMTPEGIRKEFFQK